MLGFLVGVASGLFFFLRHPVIGGLLAQLSSILDGADGDLAVMTGRVTPFGGFLDSVLDRYADAAIITGMLAGILTSGGTDSFILISGMAALSGSLVISYSRARAKSDLGLVFKGGISGYAANRDVRLFIIMIGGILDQVAATLILLAFLTNLTVIKRIYDAARMGEPLD